MTAHIERVAGCGGSIGFSVGDALHLANRWMACRDASIPIQEYFRGANRRFDGVVAVKVAVYVICDFQQRALYAGKCHRTGSSVDDRLRNHDALTDEAHSVIVIPFKSAVSDRTICDIEAMFIHELSPPYNLQRARRAA